MIGPYRTSHEANVACDAKNAERPPLAADEPLPRGRWYVLANHGYWLRWAKPGPYDEPFGRYNVDPEVVAYVTRKDTTPATERNR